MISFNDYYLNKIRKKMIIKCGLARVVFKKLRQFISQNNKLRKLGFLYEKYINSQENTIFSIEKISIKLFMS